MATISLTGFQLAPNNLNVTPYPAAATVAAGEAVYLTADVQVDVAVNTDANKDAVVGLAVQSANANNTCVIVTGGKVRVTNVLVVGDTYILADVAGDLKLAGELASTQFLTLVAVVTATNELDLRIYASGAQKA